MAVGRDASPSLREESFHRASVEALRFHPSFSLRQCVATYQASPNEKGSLSRGWVQYLLTRSGTLVDNALFGTETADFGESPDGGRFARPGRRLPDGVWFGADGPRRKTVSSVLIGDRLNCYSCALRTPLLVHHPYPTHRLSLPSYPLPESKPDETTQTMKKKDGVSAKEILRLPDLWPPTDD